MGTTRCLRVTGCKGYIGRDFTVLYRMGWREDGQDQGHNPFILVFTKREGNIKLKETAQIPHAAVASLSGVCTKHLITHIGWALQICFSFSSLYEFWRSEDVDAADLSLKVNCHARHINILH